MTDLTSISDGQREIQRLTDAGFPGPDVQKYRDEETARLRAGGFGEEEIGRYWGAPAANANDGLRRVYEHSVATPNPPPGANEEAMRAGFSSSYQSRGMDTTPFVMAASSLLGDTAGTYTGEGPNRRFVPNKNAERMAQTLLDLYSQTGVPPSVFVDKARVDPAVMAAILAHDKELQVSEHLADSAAPVTAENIWLRTKQGFNAGLDSLQRQASDPVAAAIPIAPAANAAMTLFNMIFSPAQGAAEELVGKPLEQWMKEHPGEARLLEMGPLGVLFAGPRAAQVLNSVSAGEIPDLAGPLPMAATGTAITAAIPFPPVLRAARARAPSAARMGHALRDTPPVGAPEAPPLRGAVDEPPLMAEDGAARPANANAHRVRDEHEAMLDQMEQDAVVAMNVGRAPQGGNLGLNQVMGLERSAAAARRLGINEADVVSAAGAIGRYQIMPATGKAFGFTREQLFDPVINERVARMLLAENARRFPGDSLAQAIAYNAGPVRAYKWIAAGRNDRVLPRETQGYVGRLREWLDLPGRRAEDAAADSYRRADARHSGDDNWQPPVPPRRSGGGAGGGGGGGQPPLEGDIIPPARGPRQLKPGPALTEDSLQSLIEDSYAGPVARDPWWQRINPRQILAAFQSELTRLPELPQAVVDKFRQRYASVDRVGVFVDHGPVRPNVTRAGVEYRPTGGPSYKDVFRTVREDGGKTDGFRAYRNAKRAIELSEKRGIQGPIDIGTARAFARKAKGKYERGAQLMRRWKDGAVDYLEASGRISIEEAAVWKDSNVYHISWRRQVDPKYVPPGAKPMGRFGKPKKIGESDKLIVDQDISDMDNLTQIIASGDQNIALLSFVDEMKAAHPLGSGLKLDAEATAEMRRLADRRPKVEVLDEDGNVMHEAVARQAQRWGDLGRAEGAMGQNKFTVYREGKPEVYSWEGDPVVLDILRYPWPNKGNGVQKLFYNTATVLRSGVSLTLSFMGKSVVRTAWQAFVVGKDVRPVADHIRGLYRILGKDEWFLEAQRSGALNSSIHDLDRMYLATSTAKVMLDRGILGRTWNAVNPYNWPAAARAVSRALDNAPRVEVYRRERMAGASDTRAAGESRTVLIDHAENQVSAFVNSWSRMTVFMRSSIKDIEQLGGAFHDRPLSTMVKGSLFLTVPTLINVYLNSVMDEFLDEEDRYDQVPQWQRDLFWVLPPVNGVRVRIPRPYTVGFLFGTLPERVAVQAAYKDPRAFRSWGETFMQQFMSPYMPALASPIIEAATNTEFTGAPLIPESLAKASGYMQYRADTTETAKALSRFLSPEVGLLSSIGKGFEISPIAIDNYIKGWTGTLPYDILQTMETPWHYDPKPWTVADLPLVGAFIARNPGMGAQSIQDFYDEYAKVETAHRNFSLALQRVAAGDPDAMREIQDAMKFEAFLKLNDIATGMRNQSIAVRAIENDRDMTDEEKQKLTEALYSAMVITGKAGLQAIDAFRGMEIE